MRICLLLFFVFAAPSVGVAQESLATAKALYQSAAYDEALGLLERLKSAAAPVPDVQTVAQYRAYCLLALNRQSDAEAAIEDVVKGDVFFVPSDQEVSPRVRTTFQKVRHRLLPDAARSEYARAKATFDTKDYASAADQFDRLHALLQDPLLDGMAGIADLRVLGAGFRELARAAVAPVTPEVVPPPAPPREPPPPAPVIPKVYDMSEPGIILPVAERQEVPSYPGNVRDVGLKRQAVVDVLIDEFGRVERVMIRQSIDQRYDAVLLAAATKWRYTPAYTSDGRPVKFLKRLQVSVK